MACHAKAARLWIFHESSHLIVSDLFIFSIQCFSAHSISLCVDTPCTNPTHAPPPHHYRRLPLMPPSPHHPPHFHKWCSDVHQTQQWRITISCRSLSTKALYHFVPPPPAHQHTPALPCWVLWCEGADEFLSRHFRGPHREPATCCQCKWIPKLAKIRKEVHCSTGRAELESACMSFASRSGRRDTLGGSRIKLERDPSAALEHTAAQSGRPVQVSSGAERNGESQDKRLSGAKTVCADIKRVPENCNMSIVWRVLTHMKATRDGLRRSSSPLAYWKYWRPTVCCL